MYRLSWLLVFLISLNNLSAQSNPHGPNFKIDCKKCHTSGSWKVDVKKMTFDHNATKFKLEDRHAVLNCKDCHSNLQFSNTPLSCNQCHLDIHQNSVGNDCQRCHSSKNWLVTDVSGLHAENGFMLEGAHQVVSCVDCHKNGNSMVWNKMRTDCVSCHQKDYQTTTQPNHIQVGFSTDCIECHSPFSPIWSSSFFHEFFPLTNGHDQVSCVACHGNTPYNQTSPECASCHMADYNTANNPNHQSSGFPTDCALCHTTNIGWKPASFLSHDAEYFPIYSGNHQGEWISCTDCHMNTSNYAQFTCIECHEHNDPAELADDHNDVNGYIFQSQACYQCHPTGSD